MYNVVSWIMEHTLLFAVMLHFVDMVVIYGTRREKGKTKFMTVHELFLMSIHWKYLLRHLESHDHDKPGSM